MGGVAHRVFDIMQEYAKTKDITVATITMLKTMKRGEYKRLNFVMSDASYD